MNSTKQDIPVPSSAKVPGYQTAESQADAAPPRRLAQTTHTPPKVLRMTPIYAAIYSKSEASEPFIRFPRRCAGLQTVATRFIFAPRFSAAAFGVAPDGPSLGPCVFMWRKTSFCE